MNLFEMFEQGPPKPTLIDALRDFLPIAIKHLKLDHIPKIRLVKEITDSSQPTFGRYVNKEKIIYIVVDNRNPVDVLRTLAHELVHYQQGKEHRLDQDSGNTGSPIEDEANAEGGVIMRLFNQAHPVYMKSDSVEVAESTIIEKRKRKKKTKFGGYSGYYGYYWGGDSSDSGSDGGGESVQESMGKSMLVGVLAAALSMVASPTQAEPSDAAKALGIYRMVNRYKDYNRAALEGEASQELNNILRAIQGHPDQSKLLPIIKKMITSDDNGTPPTNAEDLPPLTLPSDEVNENFSDGKNPGRKGLAKRSGVDCKQSISKLRSVAKNSSGEKQRMAHWCANMKSGRSK